MTHPNLAIGAAWIIVSNLILYFWMRRAKRKRREEQRQKMMRRLLDYPLDMFPRERYTLTPLDVMAVKELVDGDR